MCVCMCLIDLHTFMEILYCNINTIAVNHGRFTTFERPNMKTSN